MKLGFAQCALVLDAGHGLEDSRSPMRRCADAPMRRARMHPSRSGVAPRR